MKTLAVTALFFASMSSAFAADPSAKTIAAVPAAIAAGSSGLGAVYALTNDGVDNQVFAYTRAVDGTLSHLRKYSTGGIGSGVFESSTGMLILASSDGQSSPVNLGGGSNLLFAANAGSDTISVFKVANDGDLELVGVEPSGGQRPTSITVRHGVLYVLNSAGTLTGAGLCLAGNPYITGFRVDAFGGLTQIPESRRHLSGGSDAGCTQVSFNPAGDALIVTQWVANKIDTFRVDEDGVASERTENPPSGFGPFGFTFSANGDVITSVNEKQEPHKGGAASYRQSSDGSLAPIGGFIGNRTTDPCWFVVTADGRYAYEQQFGTQPIAPGPADTRRGAIALWRIGAGGQLVSVNSQVADVGEGGSDIALSSDSRFIYSRNTVRGTITGFRVEEGGALTEVGEVHGLPTNLINGAQALGSGLAAR